jgi:hypothetical protein
MEGVNAVNVTITKDRKKKSVHKALKSTMMKTD